MTQGVLTSTNHTRMPWPEPNEGELGDLTKFALAAHIPSWEDANICMQCGNPHPCVSYKLALAANKCNRDHQ